jgi:hypothetical protein
MTTPSSLPVYTQGYGTAFTGAVFVSPNAPAPTNITGPNGPFKIGQIWVDSATKTAYILVALASSQGSVTATWDQIASSSGFLDTLTGNSGVATPIAANINVVGSGGLITTTGSAGNLTIASSAGAFPITPFVVGPSGRAGYQTVQAAITAANTAGGGMVYVQPGTYTENLTWYTSVYVCSIIPTNENTAAIQPTIISGNHTIVQGAGPVQGIGASGIDFACTGNLLSSALTTSLQLQMTDCVARVTVGSLFNFPTLSPTGSVFYLKSLFVIDGGTFLVAFSGDLTAVNCQFASNGGFFENSGGNWVFDGCTFFEVVLNSGGTIVANQCDFNNTITLTVVSSAAGLFNDCVMFSAGNTAITFDGGAGGELISCTLDSTAINAISGSSASNIFIYGCDFINSTGISGLLTGLSIGSTFMVSKFRTAPPASSAFSATFGTPVQNTLGYDVSISGSVNVTAAAGGVVTLGVGPTSTPTGNGITPSLAAATVVYFSAYVPAMYYLAIAGTGVITVDAIVAVATPV